MRKPNLIYANDGRHYLVYRYDPPMTLYQLQQPVDEILGTGVDTLSFGEVSRHRLPDDKRVGLHWQWADDHPSQVMFWRAGENLRQALAAGLDPLRIVVDRAHEKGLQVLSTLMWEPLEGEKDPGNPRVESLADYALPEVRKPRLAMVEEVCEEYGLDGIEVTEYMRALAPTEDRAHASALTDFMGEVRGLLDRLGSKRGERIYLVAPVYAVEAANEALGLDIRTWLSEKLVDLVIPRLGLPLLDTNPAIDWLCEEARRAGSSVYVPVGQTPYDDRYYRTTIEMYRAAATNIRAAGADGLYLSGMPWPHTEIEYQVLREMGDPDIYRRKAKHYLLGHRDPIGPFTANEAPQIRDRDSVIRLDEDAAPATFVVERPLPATLEEGTPARAEVHVGDALNAAREDRVLERVTLGVRIMQRCAEDSITFRFNGRDLPVDAARIRSYYSGMAVHAAHRWGLPQRIWTHDWFDFDLPPELIREGENDLEVTLDRRFPGLSAERVLHQVELRIDYTEPPVPTQGLM